MQKCLRLFLISHYAAALKTPRPTNKTQTTGFIISTFHCNSLREKFNFEKNFLTRRIPLEIPCIFKIKKWKHNENECALNINNATEKALV